MPAGPRMHPPPPPPHHSPHLTPPHTHTPTHTHPPTPTHTATAATPARASAPLLPESIRASFFLSFPSFLLSLLSFFPFFLSFFLSFFPFSLISISSHVRCLHGHGQEHPDQLVSLASCVKAPGGYRYQVPAIPAVLCPELCMCSLCCARCAVPGAVHVLAVHVLAVHVPMLSYPLCLCPMGSLPAHRMLTVPYDCLLHTRTHAHAGRGSDAVDQPVQQLVRDGDDQRRAAAQEVPQALLVS